MRGLKVLWITALLAAGCLPAGCSPRQSFPVGRAQPAAESPAASPFPTTVAPEPSSAEQDPEIPAAVPTVLPDFALQPVTPQNIQHIVPIAVLEDTRYFIYSGVLSADGKWLAGSNERTVEVYEVASGERKAVFSTTGAAYLALSPDGSRLAAFYPRPWPPELVILRGDKSGGEIDPRARMMVLTVWDVDAQEVVFSKNTEDVCGKYLAYYMFQFLEDGTLALASVDFHEHAQSVCRISAEDGGLIGRMGIDPGRGYLRGLALSSDGQIAAAAFSSTSQGYADPTLVVYQFMDGKVLFEKAMAEMPEVAFVPHSHTLAYHAYTAPGGGSVELISPDGTPAGSIALPADVGATSYLKINPHFLVVENGQDEVIVFELESGEEVQRIALSPSRVPLLDARQDIGFKNISATLAAGADYLLVAQSYQGEYGDSLRRVFDLVQPGKEVLRLENPAPVSQQGGLSPGGALVAMGGLWNGDVHIWSTKNGRQALVLKGHTDVVNQVVFSPDGSKLATVSADGSARLWETATGKLLHTLNGHQGWVLRAAFSPEGTELLTSGLDGTLRLWDVLGGEELRRFEGPAANAVVDDVWFTADYSVLLNISYLGEPCVGCRPQSFLLDTRSGAMAQQPWEWPAVYGSPGGDWLLRHGGYPDYRLSIGSMPDGQFQPEKEIALTSLNNSYKIGLSPDGQWLYTFNMNGINVFDRNSGEQVGLAANYLCGGCTQHGKIEVHPTGLFLVENAPGSLILWGVPE